MINQGSYTDFRLENPMIDEIDGKFWIYANAKPDVRYEVVELLDCTGDPTDDLDLAAGGVFKVCEGSFMVFTA